ncbi:hypothetical protein GCM10027053_29280 [Intrasporangium mesophilum]
MSYQPGSDPIRRPDQYARTSPRMVIDVPRLWSGGAATAVVAALVAWIGVLIGQNILNRNLSGAAVILSPFQSLTANYALTAALLALAATGLAHLLSLSTPRPTVFFGWIVGLFTVAGFVIPFTRSGSMSDKATVAIINLVLGICVGSLLSAVIARTVVDQGTLDR